MTVAVVGGGQLGRMLALAGVPLGRRFRFLDPSADAPARAVGELVVGAYDDDDALARLAADAEVVTYEFENLPVDGLARLAARGVVVRPPVRALEIGQERLAEKQLFDGLGIEVAPYAAVDTLEGLEAAAQVIGLPVVAKTRRFGYDGKGQAVIREPREIAEAWIHLGGRPLLVERLVRFTREVSILAVRAPNGALATYPLVENHHAQGILRLSLAPAPGTSPALEAEARRIAEQVAEALDHVGVLAVELFEVDGRLLANELAPRVHNSGHWTIEGAETSQFENHVRAVLGLPLGSVRATRPTAMVNLISELPATEALLAVPGAHVHLYGKAPKPGRKLGHVTVVADDARTLVDRLEMLGRLVPLPREPLERLAGR